MGERKTVSCRRQSLEDAQITQDVESVRDKLRKGMAVCQSIEKVLGTYRFYSEKT